MEENKHVDYASSLVVGLISIFVICDSIRMYADAGESLFYSPALLPLVLGIGVFICSILLFKRSLKGSSASDLTARLKQSAFEVVKSETVKKAVIGLIIMGIYVYAALPLLGFVIATLIFLVVMMLFMKVGSIIKIGVLSVALVSVVYVLFQIVFGVVLP